MKFNVKALEGAARIEMLKAEMAKPLDQREVLLKAVVPGIQAIGYDAVMKAFEVESGEFSHDAAEYLKTAKPEDDLRVLEFVGSTERRDRDGDRILVNGWDVKEWKKSPMFLWAHGWSGFPPGVGMKVWKESSPEKALKFWVMFPNDISSEEAQKFTDMIYAYYSHKPPMLKAVSVGFKPVEIDFGGSPEENEKLDIGDHGAFIGKSELWELSGCPIGSNYDAQLVGVAKKMFGPRKGPKILDAMGFEVPEGKAWISSDWEKAAIVGENGAEAIVPLGDGAYIPVQRWRPHPVTAGKATDSITLAPDTVNKNIDRLTEETARLKSMFEDVTKKLDELKALIVAAKPAAINEAPPADGPAAQSDEEETSDDLLDDISQDVLAEAAQEIYLDPLDDIAGDEEGQGVTLPADENVDIFDEIS